MRHPTASPPLPRPRPGRAALVAAALGVCLAGALAGCDACDSEAEAGGAGQRVEEVRADDVAGDVPPAETRLPGADAELPEACLAFCEKSLECAEAGGHPIPDGARDCEVSCAPEGVHRVAPPSVWECADRPCGTAFQSCSVQAMMEHQRGSEIGAFPMTCEGLCNKAAWCAERTGAEPGPGEDDCAAACRPGGAYADVGRNEYRCVEAACGAPLQGCRAAGGPTSP